MPEPGPGGAGSAVIEPWAASTAFLSLAYDNVLLNPRLHGTVSQGLSLPLAAGLYQNLSLAPSQLLGFTGGGFG